MGEGFYISERETTVNIIGRKDTTQVYHTCEKCRMPIMFYGRMIPCKHVFCFVCACAARETDQSCARCGDAVQRIEKCPRGAVFVCRIPNCRRTYLSQRDLTAHIRHRHKQAEQMAQGLQIVISQQQPTPTAAPPVVHQAPPPVVHHQSSGHSNYSQNHSSGSMVYQHSSNHHGGHQQPPQQQQQPYQGNRQQGYQNQSQNYGPQGHGGQQQSGYQPSGQQQSHGGGYGNQRRNQANSAISSGQWGSHR